MRETEGDRFLKTGRLRRGREDETCYEKVVQIRPPDATFPQIYSELRLNLGQARP